MPVSLDPQIAEVLESLVGAMARQVIALHQTAQRVGNFNIDQVRGVQALLGTQSPCHQARGARRLQQNYKHGRGVDHDQRPSRSSRSTAVGVVDPS